MQAASREAGRPPGEAGAACGERRVMALESAGLLADVTGALREAVLAARRIASAGGAPGPSPLRLDDLLSLRAPAEESGSVRVEVYESLGGRRALRPAAPPRRLPGGLRFLGVDAGSRSVDTAPATIVVAAASLSGRGSVELADWPPVYEYPEPPPPGPPFVRLLPNAPLDWEPPPWVATRNPAGHPYGRDYSKAQAMDEARVSLENWALRAAAALAGGGGPLIVFLDGPLYLVPGALADPSAPPAVAEAWAALLRERVEAVAAVEAAGGVVVGVVKRLARSRVLSAAPRPPCMPRGEYSDEALLAYAAGRPECWGPRRGPLHALKTGKYLVRPPLGVPAPERVVEYLALPANPLNPSTRGMLMVRLEYTPRGLAALRRHGLEPSQAYLAASVAAGSRLPLPLVASDARARGIAGALARLVAAEARRAELPIDYGSLVEEAVEGWGR